MEEAILSYLSSYFFLDKFIFVSAVVLSLLFGVFVATLVNNFTIHIKSDCLTARFFRRLVNFLAILVFLLITAIAMATTMTSSFYKEVKAELKKAPVASEAAEKK